MKRMPRLSPTEEQILRIIVEGIQVCGSDIRDAGVTSSTVYTLLPRIQLEELAVPVPRVGKEQYWKPTAAGERWVKAMDAALAVWNE